MANSEISVNEETKKSWGVRRWAALINCLSGFKSANLIGTYSESSGENLAMVSSVFHLGANPTLMGFILRPHSEKSPRHTLLNIQESKQFTINGVTAGIYQKAHQTSARYAIGESEFEKVELGAEYRDGCVAPFVSESPLQMQLKLCEIVKIEWNGTHMIIGEVEKFFTELSAVQEDGFLDVEKLGLVAVSGLDSYHQTNRLNRLEYAKADLPVRVKPEA